MKLKRSEGYFSGYGVVAGAGALLLLATVGLIGVGCTPAEEVIPPGKVQAKWRLSGTTCEEAGVITVKATLTQEQSAIAFFEEADCADGELSINSVSPGTYDLAIEGLNDEGETIYKASVEDVVVVSDELTNTTTLTLKVVGGELRTEWRFDNGKFCANNNVETIEVVVTEQPSGWPALNDSVACDVAHLVGSDLRPGSYQVEVLGLNDQDNVIYRGVENATIAAAEKKTVDVVLAECSEENPCEP